MFVQADYQQIKGEVKERNRFYKTLVDIKAIAAETSHTQDLELCQEHFRLILENCEKALEGVI